MAVCSHCGVRLACPDHGDHAVEGTVEQCPLNKLGVVWVEVVDDQGRHVDGASVQACGASARTTRGGFAQFDPVASGTAYAASINDALPETHKTTHDLPLAVEQTGVAVRNGQITLVSFKLRAIVNPLIDIARKVIAVGGARQALTLKADRAFSGKGTPTCTAGADKVRFWTSDTSRPLVDGKLVFDGLDEGGVTLEVEAVDFSALDGIQLAWALTSDTDAVGPPVKGALTAVKATLTIHDKADKALTQEVKRGDGRVVLKQDDDKTHSRARLTVKCEPPEYKGTLVLKAIDAKVTLLDAAKDGTAKTLPLEIAVGGAAPASLYVQGQTTSTAKSDTGFTLDIKDVADKIDTVKVTVADIRLDVYPAASPGTPSPAVTSAAAKKDPGRLLLKQDAKFNFARSKLVLVKLPKEAPCKITLKAAGTKVRLFPAGNEKHIASESAESLPKDVAAGDVTDDGGLVFWAEGADLTSLREATFELDVDGVEDACDKAFFSVVQLTAENGTDPPPRFIPNKNKHNEGGNHHILKVKLKHSLGAGALLWSTASTKFTLADETTDTVKLTSDSVHSASLDAETLKVVFTPSGKTALPAAEHPMTVVKLTFEESANQEYGYDDMDDAARATDELHHVSVKKNGTTKVQVRIEGGATSEMIFFKSEDAAKADAVAPAAGATTFDLVLSGKNKDNDEVVLNARLNSDTGPVCDGIKVDVYKEKVVDVGVARVFDSTSPGTTLAVPFDAAGTEADIRSWYKRAVATININDLGDIDVPYDANRNGALDLFAGPGASPEQSTVSLAVPGAGLRVVIVSNLSWLYFLGANADAGDTNIIIGNGNMAFIFDGDEYPLGSGATRETIKVQSKAGNVITLDAPLAHAHTTADALEWPLSGLSGNPIWVEESGKDAAMIRRTIAHEVGHSALRLVDVVDPTNMMHFSADRTDTRLRYLKRRKHYDGGDELQWVVCHQ